MSVPSHASVIIVGGGIAGCSVAYHLTKIGVTDVVLLERKQLTCGTTWHAAGLVGQLRATRNLTELAKYTADLFHSLEAETGQATGFKQNGSISVAKTAERLEELQRGASMGKTFGLAVDELTPGEIKERWPLLEVGDVVGGIFLPKDGQTNPIDTTLALAKGAKQRGARILENTAVRRILVEQGRAIGVETADGEIRGRHGRAVRRHVVASSRRGGRRRGAAARGRAFLHRHRADRRASRATCRCCGCRTSARTTRRTPARS